MTGARSTSVHPASTGPPRPRPPDSCPRLPRKELPASAAQPVRRALPPRRAATRTGWQHTVRPAPAAHVLALEAPAPAAFRAHRPGLFPDQFQASGAQPVHGTARPPPAFPAAGQILQVTALGAQRVAGTDPAPMAFRTDHALLDPAAFLGGELEQTDPLGHAGPAPLHIPRIGRGQDPQPMRTPGLAGTDPGRIVSHTKPP